MCVWSVTCTTIRDLKYNVWLWSRPVLRNGKKRTSYTIRTARCNRRWKRLKKIQRPRTNQSSHKGQVRKDEWVGGDAFVVRAKRRARTYSTDLVRSRLPRGRVMKKLLPRNRRVPKCVCVHGTCEQNAFGETCVCTPCGAEFDGGNDVGWESGVPDRQARNVEAEDQLTARIVRRAHATEQRTPALLSLGGARRLVRLRPRGGKKK